MENFKKQILTDIFNGTFWQKGVQDYYFLHLKHSIHVADYTGGGGVTFNVNIIYEFKDIIESIMSGDEEWKEISKREFLEQADTQLRRLETFIAVYEKEQVETSAWVKVSEGLPDIDMSVLWKYESGGIIYYSLDKEEDTSRFLAGTEITGPVLYWVPAPK